MSEGSGAIPLGSMPSSRAGANITALCVSVLHSCIMKVLVFSRGVNNGKIIIHVSEGRDREETIFMKSYFLCSAVSLIYFHACSFLYLVLLPSRLPQRSRHFGGASVSGRSHLVPRPGCSTYLEITGHHP